MDEIMKVPYMPSLTNQKLIESTAVINAAGDSVKHNAYIIAKELEKLNQTVFIGQPVDDFSDIFDYAEKMFGFKKSYVYRLIRVAAFIEEKTFITKDGANTKELFCLIPRCSDTEDETLYPDYSVTQLGALLPLKKQEKILEVVADSVVNSTMTVQEIKDAIAPYIKKKEKKEKEGAGEEQAGTEIDIAEKTLDIQSRLNDILYEYKSFIESLNPEFVSEFAGVAKTVWEFNDEFSAFVSEYKKNQEAVAE